MAKSAFHTDGECCNEHGGMEAGSTDHGDAMRKQMTKHVKGSHNRGFHGKKDHTRGGGHYKEEGGAGMGSNKHHEG